MVSSAYGGLRSLAAAGAPESAPFHGADGADALQRIAVVRFRILRQRTGRILPARHALIPCSKQRLQCMIIDDTPKYAEHSQHPSQRRPGNPRSSPMATVINLSRQDLLIGLFVCPFYSVSRLLHSRCHMLSYQFRLKAADRIRISENALGIVLCLISLATSLALYDEGSLA
jgi:hypothetical protein